MRVHRRGAVVIPRALGPRTARHGRPRVRVPVRPRPFVPRIPPADVMPVQHVGSRKVVTGVPSEPSLQEQAASVGVEPREVKTLIADVPGASILAAPIAVLTEILGPSLSHVACAPGNPGWPECACPSGLVDAQGNCVLTKAAPGMVGGGGGGRLVAGGGERML